MKVSNCCGEKSQILRDGIGGYFDTVYAELCPKCGEHCEYVEEEETQKTALMELISELHPWAADKYCLYSEEQIKVVRDVINRATELLQKERKQIEEFGKKCVEIAVSNCSYDEEEEIIECDYSMAHKEITDYYNKTYKQ